MAPAEDASQPVVLGVNFGQSYASIAVITKEGHANCIANEDGERQIACAIAYSGEEVYVGNGAKPHLVKNGKNTIVGFRNLLGHTYDEVDHTAIFAAPLKEGVQVPSYEVDVLIPAPTPSTRSAAASGTTTPAIKEPMPSTKTLTVPEVTAHFLSTLFQSATDFLGSHPTGCVISCPSWFTEKQRDALKDAADQAGIPVLHILDETAAVLVGYRVGLTEERKALGLLGSPEEGDAGSYEKRDKRVVVVDMGETSLNVSVVATGEGEYVKLAHRDHKLGGRDFDDLLCAHFAKEFTKKTKVPLTIPCTESSSPQDKRAEAKLRLAVEHTKRSLSASSGAATCAVESLKDGMDLSGAINRMRFDGLAAGVYRQVGAKVREVVAEAGLDVAQIDEVLLAGSSTLFPGLSSSLALLFPATTPVTSTLDPSEVIAVGCALEALHLASLDPKSVKIEDVLALPQQKECTSAPLGLVLPGASDDLLAAVVMPSQTPLPARRRVEIPVAKGSARVGVEVWEGKDEVKVETVEPVKREKTEDDDEDEDEDDEDDEPEEIRTAITRRTQQLAGLDLELSGESAESVTFEVIVLAGGKAELRLWQTGHEDKAVKKVVG